MNEIARYKYISILRCRTWCVWPEHSRTISKGKRVPIGPEYSDSIYLSIHLVSYASRQRPENQPARIPDEEGPIIWRGDMETGYWAGQLFVKVPEDNVKVEIEHKHPYEGEIDIQLHIGAPKEY